MKLYKLKSGILIEQDDSFYLLRNENWDAVINDDNVYSKALKKTQSQKPVTNAQSLLANELEAPIQSQELWAAGVTYIRSKVGRQEESKNAGGGDFYARVYQTQHP